jgi:hypothetical protein
MLIQSNMRFKVLVAVSVNIKAFLDEMPCSLGYRYQFFGGTCCLHLQGTTFQMTIILTLYTALGNTDIYFPAAIT